MRIALTGMIASGKSEVLAELSRLGWLTMAADQLAAEAAGTLEAKDFLKKNFDGAEPKKYEIRRRFLNDPKFREEWEGVLHPKIHAAWKGFIARNPNSNVALEIPLLYEKGLEKDFDKVVLCVCDFNLALLRWQKRGGESEDYRVLAGLLMPIEAKLKKADFIIQNNTALSNLKSRVQTIHEKILNS